MAKWEEGWGRLLGTLNELKEDDLTRNIQVRWRKQSALYGIYQQWMHTVQHGGQIVYLVKFNWDGDWKYLTFPKGKTEEYNAQKRREAGLVR